MFEEKNQIANKHSVIHLRGVKQAEMQAILEYIYTGETVIPHDRTDNFLLAANDLGVTDLLKRQQNEGPGTNLINTMVFDSIPEFDDDEDIPVNFEIIHKDTIKESDAAEPSDKSIANMLLTKEAAFASSKPRKITIGFSEVISNLKIKEEVINESEKCPDCEFETEDKKALKTHIEFAHDGVNYHCHFCNFKTTVANELDLHISKDHKEIDTSLDSKLKHQCALCGKVLRSADTLRRHEKHFHYERKEKVLCEHCDRTFFPICLKRHIASNHSNIKYPCEICGKQFGIQQNLKSHVMKMHEGQRFECDQCDYKSGDKAGLQVHISAKHDKVEFKCDQCDKKYFYFQQLKRHKLSVHEGARFSCDSCNFQAAYKSDVKTHKKVAHEGVRHKCEECDYQSRHTRELRNHMKMKHKKKVTFKKGLYASAQIDNEDSNHQLDNEDSSNQLVSTDTNIKPIKNLD